MKFITFKLMDQRGYNFFFSVSGNTGIRERMSLAAHVVEHDKWRVHNRHAGEKVGRWVYDPNEDTFLRLRGVIQMVEASTAKAIIEKHRFDFVDSEVK